MSVRMLKFKVTPYGTFESGQVVAGLPAHLEYQLMESGDAVSAEVEDFASAMVGAAQNYKAVERAALGISAGRLFGVRPLTIWESVLPSPYAAAAWGDLPAYVQSQIVAEGKQATWEAMTLAQRSQVTHPSVVSVPGGWGGYSHWLAFTPYPNADSSFENPCIAASNDLRTWVVPDGVLNPLVPSPAGLPYNSDTCLYWDDVGAQMVLIFRARSMTTNNIYVTTARDPRNWSSPVLIWSGVIASAQDMASPSIWRDVVTGLWVMVGHNVDGGASWPFWRVTSSDLMSGWETAPTALSMPHPVAGRRWWHSHFIQLPTGEVVGVVQDNNGTVGTSGVIYLARSADGVTFEASRLSGTISDLYRPTIAPCITADADIVVFFSRSTGDVVTGYKHRLADTGTAEAERRRLLEALSAPARGLGFGLLTDDFERADASAGANPVGTSSGGQLWVNESSTNTIGIVSGCATNITAGNCRAHFDVGVPVYSLYVHVGAAESSDTVILRWQDGSNFLRMAIRGTPPRLEEVVAGAVTIISTAKNALVSDGDIIRIDVTRERVKFYLNGLIYMDAATARFQDATRVGLQASGTLGLAKFRAIAALPA